MTRSETLRWGGVPFSLVVGATAYLLLHGLLRALISAVGGINPDGALAQFLTVPFPAVAGSALAVGLGTLLAPRYKRQTTTALLAVVLGVAVVVGVPAMLSGAERYALALACGGSAFGAYVSREILRFDEP